MNDVAKQIDASEIIEGVEGVEETTRKLASIQRITDIKPIEGADRILCATVLGWECVIAKKDNFNVGDLIVFFEVDSILPERPEFEFLRERKFRIRTIKLKKQISQGLIMPIISILPLNVTCNEGDDLTAILGVKKHDPEGKAEKALIEKEKRSVTMRILMGIPWFRKIYLKLNTVTKGNFPSWFAKSDESRIQVSAKLMMDHYDEEWEVMEKLDGQSVSAFLYPSKVWGRTKLKFGVCSRSIWLKTPSENKYWQAAKRLDAENKLRKSKFETLITCQAEQCGPGIQGNKYKLPEVDWYMFNLIVDGNKKSDSEVISFCNENGFKHVPVVNLSFVPSKEIGINKSVPEVVAFMVKLSQGKSFLLPEQQREGIVCRLKSDPNVSLKCINAQFLLDEKD